MVKVELDDGSLRYDYIFNDIKGIGEGNHEVGDVYCNANLTHNVLCLEGCAE
jgi:hypothetical protein